MSKSWKNKWFSCPEFMQKVTYSRCVKRCSKKDREECALKNLKEEIEVERIRNLEKEKCPKCGSYLVSHLYFAFCPTCGFEDDEDEDDEGED